MDNRRLKSPAGRGWLATALAVALAAGLAACGGGGDGGSTVTGGTGAPAPGASANVVSSGVITAFGSVFVNGHRFRTENARVFDDDTGAVTAGAVGLEVGMVADVRHRRDDDEAEELHIHPLARGFVDAADATAGQLTVMGQAVQLSSATSFSDHRACVTAATPCTPVATAAGLASTTVGGTTTTPGSYVTVHGFLFNGGAGTADIVATLVSVSDTPTGSSPFNFKAEGVATVTPTSVSINGLTLDLRNARCVIAGSAGSCTGLVNGQVVSAGAAAAPTAPVTVLAADVARQLKRIEVQDAATTVELEGTVSSVGTGTFVVRGITVDISGLPAGTALPAVGDEVRVLGTLSAAGDTLQATSLQTEHEARVVRFALEGDASNVAPGAATGTFTLTLLGQAITVDSQTRLADRSLRDWDRRDPTVNPFNITTFQTYLAASASQHVQVVAEAGAGGTLIARSLVILPASTVVALAGPVDATPAVVNSTTTGTPTVFFVHGIRVSADPTAIVTDSSGRRGGNRGPGNGSQNPTTIAAGDQVVVSGTLAGTGIVVGPNATADNRVLDLGALRDDEHERDRGLF